MNVSLHLHPNERPTSSCCSLESGTACLRVNSTKGEINVFGTREQVCELLEAISAAIYPETVHEADIYGEG